MIREQSNGRKGVNYGHQSSSSSSSDNSIYAAFAAAARRGTEMRAATGAESGSPIKISSSLLSVAFFAGAFFGGAFVLPDAFRAVAFGAALVDPGASFLSKKSVTEACAVGLLFFTGLGSASLSCSLLGLLELKKRYR
jgi:hypothetical protein